MPDSFDRDARERAKEALERIIPIMAQGGLSGAMYRAEDGDEPDGYAVDYADWHYIETAVRWAVQITEGDNRRLVREVPCIHVWRHWGPDDCEGGFRGVVWEAGE